VNGQPSNVSASFECQVPASAGSFTIPASIMMALPAAGGNLSVNLNLNVQSFTAPNADTGIILLNLASVSGPKVTFH
jgi:hypothetical protein